MKSKDRKTPSTRNTSKSVAVTSLANKDLKKLASYHEKYTVNNNVFNEKHLSDNTKASHFYSLKSHPR
jgi:hypothetical protein